MAASCAKFYLPEQLFLDISSAQWFCVFVIGFVGAGTIWAVKQNLGKAVFAFYVALILIISAFGTKIFYNIDYKFGQNDLMNYAKWAKENNQNVVVLNNGRKYSVLYYYGDKITYLSIDDEDNRIQNDNKVFAQETIVIVRNKDLPELKKLYTIDTVDEGRKFSMVRFR